MVWWQSVDRNLLPISWIIKYRRVWLKTCIFIIVCVHQVFDQVVRIFTIILIMRWLQRLQVATTCFLCSPPDLNFLDPYFIFTYMHYNHCHRATAHLQLNIYYYYTIIQSRTDWLQAERSADRIPVVARFSAPVLTGPGAHPASCTMGTGSFPGVKSGRGVTLTPTPF
jgi:hypothetical protein